MSGRQCDSCKRGDAKEQKRDGVRVLLCKSCNDDWWSRERTFTRARGEVWDPAKAGAPTR